MVKNYAVVAHFDVFNSIDNNFRLLLDCLENNFDQVILVSTSQLREQSFISPSKITIITRPNTGYDFYSYKVGYEFVLKNFEEGNILFTNSSFLILNTETFEKTLKSAIQEINHADVVSLTSSNQISWHLQSYFILLSKNTLGLGYIHNFFRSIQPLNSKFELIIQYELGLSALLKELNLRCNVLFKASLYQKVVASYGWGCRVYSNSLKKWKFVDAIKECSKANLTHFCAKEIANKFGIVKSELLRTNPHSLNLRFIKKISSSLVRSEIESLINDSKLLYQSSDSGLTTLKNFTNNKLGFTPISYGQRGRIGVRIAVVMHLYYFDLLDEIAGYLNSIVEPYDVYVTTPFAADIPGIINKMAPNVNSVTVLLTENRGRDIGPFIKLYRSGYLDGYMAILKLHSKKSKYSPEGQAWRRQLYEKVVGDALMVRRTVLAFELGVVGIVGPAEYYLTNGPKFWGANYEAVKKIIQSTKRFSDDYEPNLGFFAGSMFWFSPKALLLIKEIPEEVIDFEDESGKQDGTLAHAFERIFALFARKSGYVVTSASVANYKDMAQVDTASNNVPVL
jgi:rhamnosyltransferase